MDDLRHRYARLVAAFRAEDRATTDLGRVAEEAEALAEEADSTWLRVQACGLAAAARAVGGVETRLDALVLNGAAAWTAERLARAIGSLAWPGLHLAQMLRPAAAGWSPSPETTIDCGLRVVGREVLVTDHELAVELERIGRLSGARWNGDRLLQIRRDRDSLAPAIAALAVSATPDDARHALPGLWMHPGAAERLVLEWPDPLTRAALVARAAGPPLVRAWLAVTGQTTGLGRLLRERLVPTMLRAEVADAGG